MKTTSKIIYGLLNLSTIIFTPAWCSNQLEYFDKDADKILNALKDVENNKKSIINKLAAENRLVNAPDYPIVAFQQKESKDEEQHRKLEIKGVYVPREFNGIEYSSQNISDHHMKSEKRPAFVYGMVGTLGCIGGAGIFVDGVQKGSVAQGCFGLTMMGWAGFYLQDVIKRTMDGRTKCFENEITEEREIVTQYSPDANPMLARTITERRVIENSSALSAGGGKYYDNTDRYDGKNKIKVD